MEDVGFQESTAIAAIAEAKPSKVLECLSAGAADAASSLSKSVALKTGNGDVNSNIFLVLLIPVIAGPFRYRL